MSRELPDWIESYLEYTENTESPLIYRLWVSLSVIASALERKCKMPGDLPTSFIYPNMYVVLIAPPAKARKSTAMASGYDLLKEIEVKVAPASITREAFIEVLEKSGKHITIESDNPGSPIAMGYHCSLTIFSPELTTFLSFNNRQMIIDLTDLYDCREEWSYKTKHHGENIVSGVWINLLGATTTASIQESLPKESFGGGLISRFVFVFASKKARSIPFPESNPHLDKLREHLVADLFRINMLQGVFSFASDYRKIYADWYNSYEGEVPHIKDTLLSGYLDRRQTHLRKLCMIVNVSRTDSMILEAIDFERALKILETTEKKMDNAFSSVGKTEKLEVLQRMMEVIISKRAQGISIRALARSFYKDMSYEEVETRVKDLERMGFCDLHHSETDTTIFYKDRPKT